MSKHLIAACALALAAVTAQAAPNDSRATAARTLHKLFDDEWQRGLRDYPENASYLGDKRYNALWTDMSLDAIARRDNADRQVLIQLANIPRAALTPADQLNYDLFKRQYQEEMDGYVFRQFLLPVNQLGGLQTSDEIIEALPFDTTQDYEDWLARLRAFGNLADQTITLMRTGMAEKRTPPKVVMQRVPKQLAHLITEKAEDNSFYRPFLNINAAVPAADRARLAQQGAAAVRDVVLPALKRFQSFYNDTYLPACRDSIAASDQPDGAEFYRYSVARFTTTTMTPEQIHQIGLREVARIRAQMEQTIRDSGFTGSFEDFQQFLRSDPQFFFKDGDELLHAYEALGKRIDPELPKLFGKLPRLPYGVRAVPELNAPNQTTAYYQPGAADGTRAGYFYANLYKPETRPKWEMEALTAHEAVPGHHLQIALGQELGELPMFRRNSIYTAFVEGWGLYAESLGGELGLYKDPYSKFGQLTYEMWRAIRLVVDTGMHSKGWTRQQAVDLFKANTGRSDLDIGNEVDRYIAWPGQALAYKIGQLKIKELRERAQAKLGGKFSLREFHDVVLGSGALPLDILERNVDAWIAAKAAAKKS